MPSYAEDRAEIEDLMARYLFALDWGDGDAYAACFTEDGEIDWARETTRGRPALAAMCNGFAAAMEAIMGKGVPHRHFLSHVAVTVKGDTAQARAAWFEAARREDGFGKSSFGHYEDHLVRVGGRWLFRRRKIYNEFLPGRTAGATNPVMEEGMKR
ncbi:MAG: nuclear transport factor 2 family protein [Sphingomonadales bacterium]|nr:nuclear transport factor 2 family protein [Sphingomonadales bacterium]MDE2567417.1 nuclear transport factor 2 family protein [Sphingomonadales bacterium]